jgi:hypothetical protein
MLLDKEKPRLSGVFCEAGDETRTHDPQLGKLMLYQLSYTRVAAHSSAAGSPRTPRGEPFTRVQTVACALSYTSMKRR